tara:strand:- start:238 stop:375 length:138 start_codon:yes stop_codon:yes gene_type:complete
MVDDGLNTFSSAFFATLFEAPANLFDAFQCVIAVYRLFIVFSIFF